MRSRKKTRALIRRLILILASLETNKIQKHFSRCLQIFWGSRLFVFSQGCSRYAGRLQRASPMVCSPRCLTSGVTAYSSTRWSPSAAFPFKASLTIRSLNICLCTGSWNVQTYIPHYLDLTSMSSECPLEGGPNFQLVLSSIEQMPSWFSCFQSNWNEDNFFLLRCWCTWRQETPWQFLRE